MWLLLRTFFKARDRGATSGCLACPQQPWWKLLDQKKFDDEGVRFLNAGFRVSYHIPPPFHHDTANSTTQQNKRHTFPTHIHRTIYITHQYLSTYIAYLLTYQSSSVYELAYLSFIEARRDPAMGKWEGLGRIIVWGGIGRVLGMRGEIGMNWEGWGD